MFKRIFRFLFMIIASVFLLAVSGEAISHLFLPKPTIHKLPEVHFIADSACGYRLTPNQKGYTLGSLATINKWGFRGKDWSLDKPESTYRVAVLGSSYAFGHGVGDEEMYSAQLESRLNQNAQNSGKKYEVMSFGLGGYDTGHEINALKAYALKFKPDTVVLSFFFNDVFYIKDYGFYGKMFAEQERNFSVRKWKLRNYMRNSRLAMYLWDEFKDRQGAHEPGEVGEAINAYVREGLLPPDQGPKAEEWHLITDRIREFKDLSQTYGFKPILIIIPTHQEMLEKNIHNSYTPYLQKLGQELGIPTFAVLDALKRTGKDLTYFLIPYDFHLSVKGHTVIADLLADKIKNT